ncbi:hypothetical protein EB796_023210 [Bugula neritina]|uniref:Uncharacterized protein n=1 Tax=Bugula neritina TaxID=10212 RepID=A0A7J7IXC3_BUGNE|nr:hypothetical protein EB796_023210 [Bugula neritina]
MTTSTHLLCPKFTVSQCEQNITLIGDKCYEGGFGQIHPCFDICNNLPSDPGDESGLDMCNALCPVSSVLGAGLLSRSSALVLYCMVLPKRLLLLP